METIWKPKQANANSLIYVIIDTMYQVKITYITHIVKH